MGATQKPRRDLLAFGRSDRWGLALLLALVAVVTVVVQVVQPAARWVDGDPMPVGYAGRVGVPALDALGVRHEDGSVTALVPDPGTTVRVVDLLLGLCLSAVVLGGGWLVLRVMRDVAAGDPFRPANVTRLRVLAGLVAIALPAVWFGRASVDAAALTRLGPDLVVLVLDLPWLPVLAGTFVALLAEAFKLGGRLRDDVEGLV